MKAQEKFEVALRPGPRPTGKKAGAQKAPARRGRPPKIAVAQADEQEPPAKRRPGRPPKAASAASRRDAIEAALSTECNALEALRDCCDEWGLDDVTVQLDEALPWIAGGLAEFRKLAADWTPPEGGAPLGEGSIVQLHDASAVTFRRALGGNPKAEVAEQLEDGHYLLSTEGRGAEIVVHRRDFRVLRRVRPEAHCAPGSTEEVPGSQLDIEHEAQRIAAERHAESHANGEHQAV